MYREPEFLPWDGRIVPLTLLGGYLGVGKTTIINELLARTDRPIAVLVNDVGAVNVDAALIRRRDRETIEFTDGCVCCSLSGGLGPAFDQLRDRPDPPDQVIVELSGVADPDRVRPWGKSAGFRLDGVVVLVDCDQYYDMSHHRVIGPTLMRQIEAADILVLTKTDLVGSTVRASVEAELRIVAPATPVVDSATALTTAGILELGAEHPDGIDVLSAPNLFDQYSIDAMAVPVGISRPDLDVLVEALPAEVIRAKGIVQADTGDRLLVQVVGKRRVITQLSTGGLTEEQMPMPTDLVIISLT